MSQVELTMWFRQTIRAICREEGWTTARLAELANVPEWFFQMLTADNTSAGAAATYCRLLDPDAYEVEKNVEQEERRRRWLAAPVQSINGSVRLLNALINCDVHTIGELTKLQPKELLRLNNFGRKTLREVNDILASIGLSLRTGPLTPDEVIARGKGAAIEWRGSFRPLLDLLAPTSERAAS